MTPAGTSINLTSRRNGMTTHTHTRVIMFQSERGGGLTRQPLGPSVDTAIMTVLSTNRVDSRSFSSRGCAFRRTHTSTDPIRILWIRLALPSTLSLPSRFAPSSKLKVGVSPRASWLAGAFLCDCTLLEYRGGGLTRQPRWAHR